MSTEYWVLSAEYWVLSAEYWVLSTEYWVLSAECWILSTQYWDACVCYYVFSCMHRKKTYWCVLQQDIYIYRHTVQHPWGNKLHNHKSHIMKPLIALYMHVVQICFLWCNHFAIHLQSQGKNVFVHKPLISIQQLCIVSHLVLLHKILFLFNISRNKEPVNLDFLACSSFSHAAWLCVLCSSSSEFDTQ